jgi:1-acyl-sn-glycerol-3-phosphate acyltransferase
MNNWSYENEQWTQLPGHMKHLPLFTRQFDLTSWFFRMLWGAFLSFIFRFYVFLKVKGDYHELWKKHPRLLVISNHASHIDAVSITASIPIKYWLDLYISAAKDYWFSNPLFTFFSKHCLGAIPIDRKDKKGEAIKLCTTLLTKLDRIWLILFPEGTRSSDGYINEFKKGVVIFSQRTKTPILCLYLEGNSTLFPKGAAFAKPGVMTVHIGPVLMPDEAHLINEKYKEWVLTINPNAYRPNPEIVDNTEDEFMINNENKSDSELNSEKAEPRSFDGKYENQD